MSWIAPLVILFLSLIIAFATSLPVGFAFGLVNFVALLYLLEGFAGLSFITQSAFSSVANFSLAAVPFFILMGSIMLKSGISRIVLDSVEVLLGGLRNSGSYVAVIAGGIFGALMGASIASTALLGSTLVPEMRSRGYTKALSLGPVIGSGTLAGLIPPSVAFVLVGGYAGISIGDLLIAGIAPAMLIIILFSLYIFIQSRVIGSGDGAQPSPPIRAEKASIKELLQSLLNLTSVAIPIFFVTGVIYLGVATPTEASVTGALGAFLLTIIYRKMSWKIFNEILLDAVQISAMIFIIIAGSRAYSQVLALTGISRGMTEFMANLTFPPTAVVGLILLFVLGIGCFMDQTAVIFVVLPLVIGALEIFSLDPIWFGVLFVMATIIGGITPPFGLNLFVLKGVSPNDITIDNIYFAALPFVALLLVALTLVLFIPPIATFLI